MDVTEVKVFPVNEEKLKAYATITFDNCFIVRDLKVIHGQSGLFVAMPSKKRKDGTYKDTAHPINSETRAMIEAKVLEEYERELRRTGENPPAPPRPIPGAASADKTAASTPGG
jgi:stage V sporulation protein G